MATVTKPGVIPEERKPWYLDMEMTCPICHAQFTLDEADIADPDHKDRPWSVRTERSLNGKSEAHGPCPFCHKQITIVRPPAFIRDAGKSDAVYANVRASLPADANGVRWAKERGVKAGYFGRPGPKVAAIPTIDGSPAIARYGDALIHTIRRVDGQIVTDATSVWESFWNGWEECGEAEASTLDQELVDFVQRLRLVKSTLKTVKEAGAR